MEHAEIVSWLRESSEERLEELWARADAVRRAHVGNAVYLRGLIEFSNRCVRQCGYCGLRVGNGQIERYCMSPDEILECARKAVQFGYGTVVLQSGEDPTMDAAWMSDVIRGIKRETSLAVTLSVGERSEEDLVEWRKAGADRFLMRFETSNRALFERIHPSLPGRRSDRIALLRRIKALGYETGSGVLIGIPGQTWDDLARDIALFRELDLDMIGVGPYIPHPDTPLGHTAADEWAAAGEQQVLNDEATTYKVIALARLICPNANIPSTTALATLNLAQGRELGLSRGANICMPNLTPIQYRAFYEIYPAKACIRETADQCHGCMQGRIVSIGRHVGVGRGDSPNKIKAAQ